MNKRIISAAVGVSLILSAFSGFAVTANAAVNIPQQKRYMEELNRGLIATYRVKDDRTVMSDEAGVYLSWRLFGTEDLANQGFDIYRSNSATGAFYKIGSTGAAAATNYIDKTGTLNYYYKVVKAGASAADVAKEKAVKPGTNNTAKGSEVGKGNSEKNSFTYVDIPITLPEGGTAYNGVKYTYTSNDASVGDLDGDGDYELVLKWDPSNSQDNGIYKQCFTGNVYIDGYEISENNNGYMWRIDLGINIRAGAHYTQYIVYDFDGDGKAEIAMKTAPGSKDGLGRYVTETGDTETIRNADNNADYRRKSGELKYQGRIFDGPEYLTIFDGETGAALYTTDYIARGNITDWGDKNSKLANQSERYLAGVAYLDGVHPSLIMCRGYYHRAWVRAYTWDGKKLTEQWTHKGNSLADDSLYGQGNHQLSIADVDNDGKDEIVYGSAAVDDDGTIIGNTKLMHGDALHVSDFNNDGVQEAFSVKEDAEGYTNNAADFRVAGTGRNIWGKGAGGDTGRGVMANIDDEYAAANPDGLALAWSSSHDNVFNLTGNELKAKPAKAGSGTFDNSLVYWDGDLGRELLDDNIIQKYDAENGWSKRFFGPNDGYTLTGGSTNNDTKRNASLSVDLWGDWREEIIMPVRSELGDTALRIFTSTLPTEYRLTTLMHDSQYRTAIAWQNVGYNQPPHTSYYIGSAALKDGEKYLAPEVPYTLVKYPSEDNIPVTGISLSTNSLTVERAKTEVITANIAPVDATQTSVTWSSSDETVATVSNGVVRGVSRGEAVITATTRDGGYTATCNVNVWSTDTDGVTLSQNLVNVTVGDSAQVSAVVSPENASDKSLIWSSSNEAIAKVASDGTIMGISSGIATVYATTVDGGYRAGCAVNVIPLGDFDVTGDDVFKTTNTDVETVLSNETATSANFSQTEASTVGSFYRTFEKFSENKATLQFTFTTGGKKLDGSNWNWTGHEYSFYVKLLGENDDNIITLSQAFTSSAQPTKSKIGNENAVDAKTTWNSIDNGGTDNPFGRSSTTWHVTAEFDYNNDMCNITVLDKTDKEGYTTSFALNGKSFEKLEIASSVDGSGAITWTPGISDVSYVQTVPVSGASSTLYSRGTKTGTSWTDNDLKDWTQTGTTTAALKFGTDENNNGRIYYNPTDPTGSYSASRTFKDISDNAILTYDVDWMFGRATGRESNYEYIQFGSNLRLGWNSTYNVFVSTDGGTTYGADAIYTGSNAEFTKNIKVEFNTESKMINSLTFDGQEIAAYRNYKLPDTALIDSITFGFDRGGKVSDNKGYLIPSGIQNITVSQFEDDAKPKFNIRFIDYDNTPLKDIYVEAGEMPEYGEAPERATDEKYTYTFTGWSPKLSAAVEEAVYKAQYETSPRSYSVTLHLNDGILDNELTAYTYGTAVDLPIPSKDGYKFVGWYENAEGSGTKVAQISSTDTGDKTYYAKWTAIPTVNIDSVDGQTAVIGLSCAEACDKMQLIGVLYDKDSVVKEVQTESVTDMDGGVSYSKSLDFENNIDDYTLKVFVWDSFDNMIPLLETPKIR